MLACGCERIEANRPARLACHRRTLSPSELCLELQIPLSNTSYHVTELHKAGLVKLARTRPVRGSVEHFYRLP